MSEAPQNPPDSGSEAPAPTHFQVLCGSLAAQVQMALGLIVDPVTKEAKVELDVARQGIALLETLEVKTKGNLEDVETKTLGGILAHLRMLYVERAKEQAAEGISEQEKKQDPEQEPAE